MKKDNQWKVTAIIFIIVGILFMIVIKLSQIWGGNGFIIGAILAFVGFYILIEKNDKKNKQNNNN